MKAIKISGHKSPHPQLHYSLTLGLLLSAQWPQSLSAHSFQYQPLLLLNISTGMSNFATRDTNETPGYFVFAEEVALSRYAMMPQGDLEALLVLHNNYVLHFQLLLNNLRNQQSNFAFGIGNENVGLLFGPAQEYTLASESRPNLFGFGPYIRVYYNLQGLMELQLEGTFLTNTINNARDTDYRNMYLYLKALFMISQLRIGITGSFNFFDAGATGPGLIQIQNNLVFGGSAPARFLLLDFYLSNAFIFSQGITDSNYSAMFLGLGLKLKFTVYRRVAAGFYFEAMPFGLSLDKLGTIDEDTTGFSFGLTLQFRISRKELWSPEIIPHSPRKLKAAFPRSVQPRPHSAV